MKYFHLQRKVHMTLLETLIAMSLLSVLLVFVFGFFRELSEITRLNEQAQKQSFQMRYLESRLEFIFERVVNEKETSRKLFFYTQPAHRGLSLTPSLILTFYNEVRLDPYFSGDVLGRLYVDEEKRLCLATWPLHVLDPFKHLQEEVLLENVIDVRYSFYAAPERIKDRNEIVSHAIDPEKKTPGKNQWHPEWLITYNQMPSIVEIIVKVAQDAHSTSEQSNKDKVKEYLFQFVLPSSKNYIHYPPGELSA